MYPQTAAQSPPRFQCRMMQVRPEPRHILVGAEHIECPACSKMCGIPCPLIAARDGRATSFRTTAQIVQELRCLPRFSQNVRSQRQHAAQPDSVVDVIGVGVAGAWVEQDAQTVAIEPTAKMRPIIEAEKQPDTSIAYAARPACRAIAQASRPGRWLPRVLVAARHGRGSTLDRNIRERDNAG